MTANRHHWPVMVRLSLHYFPTRRWALRFFYFTATFAALFVTLSILFHKGYVLSAYFATASLWDYLAIRWVDRNSTWS